MNIVITDIPGETFEGAVTVYSIDEAISQCSGDEECFIIGGGMVYRQFLKIADRLYITWVHKVFEADTFFPQIDPEIWEEANRTEGSDNSLDFNYSFVTYLRR